MNGAPNETRIHSCKFASPALLTIKPTEAPSPAKKVYEQCQSSVCLEEVDISWSDLNV